MAVQFPTYKQAYYDNANWLDDVSSWSWASWVQFDSVAVGSRQTICGHYGATNRFYIRKTTGTPELFQASITSGGVYKAITDTTGAPVVDTAYHLAVTWEAGSATGLKIYRNGAYVTAVSTSTQTANYNSGGNVDLYVGSLKKDTDTLRGQIEGFGIWAGTVLTANQIAALYWSGWPHLAGLPKPTVWWPGLGYNGRIQDWSGNGRHIEAATIDATVAAASTIGQWDAPWHSGGSSTQGAAGPAAPNEWTLFGTTTHPTVTLDVTGLVNDTMYDFAVTAVDDDANESVKSATVTATPEDIGTVHTEKLVFIGH